MAMKKPRMKSFRITIAVFAHALSRIPITSTHVMAATIRTAGRLKMIGTPKMWGAAVHAFAIPPRLAVVAGSACTALYASYTVR